MIGSFILSLKIKMLIDINRLRRILNVDRKILIILVSLKNIFKELFNKTSYTLIFIVLFFLEGKRVSLNIFIIFTFIGMFVNSILFASQEIKKIMLNNFKVDSKFIVINYYYVLLLQLLFLIPGLFIYSYIAKLSLLSLLLFILNVKSLFIMVMLYLYKHYRFCYDGDEPSNLVIVSIILLSIILIFILYFKVDISTVIDIINYIGIISHIYIIGYDEYSSLVREKNLYIKDYEVKEQFKIKRIKVREVSDASSYLERIFVVRHYKYLVFYILKGIVASSIFIIFFFNYQDIDDLVRRLVIICWLSNSIFKIIDLYYYKCDYYLYNMLDKVKLYKIRFINILVINMISSLPVLGWLIVNGLYRYIIVWFILVLLFAFLALNLLMIFKTHNDKEKQKIYYIFNVLILIVLIILDIAYISRLVIYVAIIILLFINIFVVKSWVCKVNLNITKIDDVVVK